MSTLASIFGRTSSETDVLSLSRLFERVRQTNAYPTLKAWLSLLTHDLTGG